MKYQDFFVLPKNHIFIARSEDIYYFILFLFFTCESVDVAMGTNMKRAPRSSRSGARQVVFKFLSQNGFVLLLLWNFSPLH